MSYDKFKPDDIFVNTIKAHPKQSFFIYNSEVYINQHGNLTGQNGPVTSVPAGYVSLYELNIDRTSNYISASEVGGTEQAIPDKTKFNTLEGKAHRILAPSNTVPYWSYTNHKDYEAPTSQNYPLSASITRQLTVLDSYNKNLKVDALRNVALKYAVQSPHFELTSSFLARDLTKTDNINLIHIPTIFYESTIKKGTVNLKFNITGTLLAECADTRRNGELIETTGTNPGSVVGLVFYDEGLIMLTASHDLVDGVDINYENGGTSNTDASWITYGTGMNDGTSGDGLVSASFGLDFEATSYTNTMTLFCHAPKGKYNFSNNPTSIDSSSAGQSITKYSVSDYTYKQPRLPIKNVMSSSYSGYDEEFKRKTYISKIGIYDEDDNLIMIAALSKPVKKEENDEYTFKLTYDI